MRNQRILISGAGIAGPALAWALRDRPWDVTVIERAPRLREGGQAVDFRGPVHREVLERLGLWDAICARRTPGSDLVLLDRQGHALTTLPAVMMSGDVEILRGDLSQLLHERTAGSAEYRFGDRLTALEAHADGVTVELASGTSATYDVVVGADGLHSGVRALAFGDEARYTRHHGYRLATYSLPDRPGRGDAAFMYSVPGRAVMLAPQGAGRARALFVFAGADATGERLDAAGQAALLREVYRGVGWRVPDLLAELPGATDLYVDDIASIVIDRYARGRVVLLGDAAYGGTLGGQGTPLAIVGAYVLAGELAAAPGDPRAAFARYEACMRPYATACQKGAARAGEFFAPRTRLGLGLRNLFYRAFTSRLLLGQFEKLVKASATAFELPDHGRVAPAPPSGPPASAVRGHVPPSAANP